MLYVNPFFLGVTERKCAGIPHTFFLNGVLVFLMAGAAGFEPTMPESESGALPLGDAPVSTLNSLTQLSKPYQGANGGQTGTVLDLPGNISKIGDYYYDIAIQRAISN